jgi:uncharacterized protein YjbJ (UPF0337 family)
MDTPNMRSNWRQVAKTLKRRFGNRTDADLAFTEGKEEELLTTLERKLGKSREDLRTLIAAL